MQQMRGGVIRAYLSTSAVINCKMHHITNSKLPRLNINNMNMHITKFLQCIGHSH